MNVFVTSIPPRHYDRINDAHKEREGNVSVGDKTQGAVSALRVEEFGACVHRLDAAPCHWTEKMTLKGA